MRRPSDKPAPTTTEPTDIPLRVRELLAPDGVAGRYGHAAVNDDNFAWLPAGSVDLVLTDPPFNIAQDTNFHTYEKNTIHSYRFDKDKGWDTYSDGDFIALLHEWARNFARVLRPGGTFAVFCADEYVSHLMDALESAKLKNRRVITWRKPNAVPINRQTMMMSACEYVVMGVKGSHATFNSDVIPDTIDGAVVAEFLIADKVANVVEATVHQALADLAARSSIANPVDLKATLEAALETSKAEAVRRVQRMFVPNDSGGTHIRGCVPNIITETSKGGKRLHPTEKPVSILAYLTALFSRPGDVVLDPFGGSGSTGEAALRMGRRVIVVEQDPAFFASLEARLDAIGVGGD